MRFVPNNRDEAVAQWKYHLAACDRAKADLEAHERAIREVGAYAQERGWEGVGEEVVEAVKH